MRELDESSSSLNKAFEKLNLPKQNFDDNKIDTEKKNDSLDNLNIDNERRLLDVELRKGVKESGTLEKAGKRAKKGNDLYYNEESLKILADDGWFSGNKYFNVIKEIFSGKRYWPGDDAINEDPLYEKKGFKQAFALALKMKAAQYLLGTMKQNDAMLKTPALKAKLDDCIKTEGLDQFQVKKGARKVAKGKIEVNNNVIGTNKVDKKVAKANKVAKAKDAVRADVENLAQEAQKGGGDIRRNKAVFVQACKQFERIILEGRFDLVQKVADTLKTYAKKVNVSLEGVPFLGDEEQLGDKVVRSKLSSAIDVDALKSVGTYVGDCSRSVEAIEKSIANIQARIEEVKSKPESVFTDQIANDKPGRILKQYLAPVVMAARLSYLAAEKEALACVKQANEISGKIEALVAKIKSNSKDAAAGSDEIKRLLYQSNDYRVSCQTVVNPKALDGALELAYGFLKSTDVDIVRLTDEQFETLSASLAKSLMSASEANVARFNTELESVANENDLAKKRIKLLAILESTEITKKYVDIEKSIVDREVINGVSPEEVLTNFLEGDSDLSIILKPEDMTTVNSPVVDAIGELDREKAASNYGDLKNDFDAAKNTKDLAKKQTALHVIGKKLEASKRYHNALNILAKPAEFSFEQLAKARQIVMAASGMEMTSYILPQAAYDELVAQVDEEMKKTILIPDDIRVAVADGTRVQSKVKVEGSNEVIELSKEQIEQKRAELINQQLADFDKALLRLVQKTRLAGQEPKQLIDALQALVKGAASQGKDPAVRLSFISFMLSLDVDKEIEVKCNERAEQFCIDLWAKESVATNAEFVLDHDKLPDLDAVLTKMQEKLETPEYAEQRADLMRMKEKTAAEVRGQILQYVDMLFQKGYPQLSKEAYTLKMTLLPGHEEDVQIQHAEMMLHRRVTGLMLEMKTGGRTHRRLLRNGTESMRGFFLTPDTVRALQNNKELRLPVEELNYQIADLALLQWKLVDRGLLPPPEVERNEKQSQGFVIVDSHKKVESKYGDFDLLDLDKSDDEKRLANIVKNPIDSKTYIENLKSDNELQEREVKVGEALKEVKVDKQNDINENKKINEQSEQRPEFKNGGNGVGKNGAEDINTDSKLKPNDSVIDGSSNIIPGLAEINAQAKSENGGMDEVAFDDSVWEDEDIQDESIKAIQQKLAKDFGIKLDSKSSVAQPAGAPEEPLADMEDFVVVDRNEPKKEEDPQVVQARRRQNRLINAIHKQQEGFVRGIDTVAYQQMGSASAWCRELGLPEVIAGQADDAAENLEQSDRFQAAVKMYGLGLANSKDEKLLVDRLRTDKSISKHRKEIRNELGDTALFKALNKRIVDLSGLEKADDRLVSVLGQSQINRQKVDVEMKKSGDALLSSILAKSQQKYGRKVEEVKEKEEINEEQKKFINIKKRINAKVDEAVKLADPVEPQAATDLRKAASVEMRYREHRQKLLQKMRQMELVKSTRRLRSWYNRLGRVVRAIFGKSGRVERLDVSKKIRAYFEAKNNLDKFVNKGFNPENPIDQNRKDQLARTVNECLREIVQVDPQTLTVNHALPTNVKLEEDELTEMRLKAEAYLYFHEIDATGKTQAAKDAEEISRCATVIDVLTDHRQALVKEAIETIGKADGDKLKDFVRTAILLAVRESGEKASSVKFAGIKDEVRKNLKAWGVYDKDTSPDFITALIQSSINDFIHSDGRLRLSKIRKMAKNDDMSYAEGRAAEARFKTENPGKKFVEALVPKEAYSHEGAAAIMKQVQKTGATFSYVRGKGIKLDSSQVFSLTNGLVEPSLFFNTISNTTKFFGKIASANVSLVSERMFSVSKVSENNYQVVVRRDAVLSGGVSYGFAGEGNDYANFSIKGGGKIKRGKNGIVLNFDNATSCQELIELLMKKKKPSFDDIKNIMLKSKKVRKQSEIGFGADIGLSAFIMPMGKTGDNSTIKTWNPFTNANSLKLRPAVTAQVGAAYGHETKTVENANETETTYHSDVNISLGAKVQLELAYSIDKKNELKESMNKAMPGNSEDNERFVDNVMLDSGKVAQPMVVAGYSFKRSTDLKVVTDDTGLTDKCSYTVSMHEISGDWSLGKISKATTRAIKRTTNAFKRSVKWEETVDKPWAFYVTPKQMDSVKQTHPEFEAKFNDVMSKLEAGQKLSVKFRISDAALAKARELTAEAAASPTQWKKSELMHAVEDILKDEDNYVPSEIIVSSSSGKEMFKWSPICLVQVVRTGKMTTSFTKSMYKIDLEADKPRKDDKIEGNNDVKIEGNNDVKIEGNNDVKIEGINDVKIEDNKDVKHENNEEVKLENIKDVKHQNDEDIKTVANYSSVTKVSKENI